MSTMMEYQRRFSMFDNQTSSAPRLYKDEDGQTVYLLASGFSTFHNHEFVQTEKDTSETEMARVLTMSKTIAKETEGLYYNIDATTLFELYYKNTELSKNFEFREEVFKNFIKNLGFVSLFYLFKAQLHNSYITSSHVAYLKETLDLLSGYIDRRQVSNESWSTLLYHERRDFSKGKDDIKQILMNNQYKVLNEPYWKIIPYWLNTVYGMSDLIWFNKLVWGRPLGGRID